MANCVNYNCDPLGDHEISILDCGAAIPGGISSLVILDCSHQLTDPSDGTQINAEIAAGRAWLVENVKVGMDAPSAVTQDPTTSCGGERIATYDRTLTIEDYNVSAGNNEFYSTVFGGRSFGGAILAECGDDELDPVVTFINKEITAEGGRIVPNTVDESQRFEGTFKWKSRTLPAIAPAPTGVFS